MPAVDRTESPDLVCLSHLRWDFVYQRPQHLMSRFARHARVFYVEEPVGGADEPRLEVTEKGGGLRIAVPHLPDGCVGEAADEALRRLLDRMIVEHDLSDFVLWYYTPMAISFSRHLRPAAIVYDCMDELSLFQGAPPTLLPRERELLGRADLVFTGGASLYSAKRDRHPSVHLFASSIDREHFASARSAPADPEEQAGIGRPRLGFFGVIDERMDIPLLAQIAVARPDWQIVLIGPVVKIDPATLPRFPNIHYLGSRAYADLPAFAAGWDVALLPFALNDATRFISPTKIPEYLATGVPVVSTPIMDVVEPYGREGYVRIAAAPNEFIAAVEACLMEGVGDSDRLQGVDRLLTGTSWDSTWSGMLRLIEEVLAGRSRERGRRDRFSPAASLAKAAEGTRELEVR